MTFTLPKRERLCSKTLIDQLFLGHSDRKKEWPIKVVYQVVKRADEQDPQVEVLMSVSKRQFKRAVKRNLVKRQLRENYRLHKSVLYDALVPYPDAKIVIAFIWMSAHVYATSEIEASMVKALNRVAHDLVPAEPKKSEA